MKLDHEEWVEIHVLEKLFCRESRGMSMSRMNVTAIRRNWQKVPPELDSTLRRKLHECHEQSVDLRGFLGNNEVVCVSEHDKVRVTKAVVTSGLCLPVNERRSCRNVGHFVLSAPNHERGQGELTELLESECRASH